MYKNEDLELRNLLIKKVREGEIKCPLSKKVGSCINCDYLRICAEKLKEK
ncbi:MAG: hypothetical protein J7L08_02580 [Candidatus Aenigmarchaeota archaeon]|nr:hypothetical protein [Candidatus Aenigmarchaeota archaeon]